MSYVCLWSPRWPTAAAPLADLAVLLLSEAPRIAVDARGLVWADARGLPAPRTAVALCTRAQELQQGVDVRAGVAAVPVAAEVAARSSDSPLTVLEPGHERAFLAPHPLELLTPDPHVLALLHGVGIRTCGALSELPREAVEVRFGAAGSALWRMARADDERLLFRPAPPERPSAAVEFPDYSVADAGRLLFPINALLESVCTGLRNRGETARTLLLELGLEGGGAIRERLGSGIPTAERRFWLARVRARLDTLALPDRVSGIRLFAEETWAAGARQGDFFDSGFASAAAVEEALSRILDANETAFVQPRTEPHPLPEARTSWVPLDPSEVVEPVRRREKGSAALRLHLLPEPQAVAVRVEARGGTVRPRAFREKGRWHPIPVSAGPDRLSGGHAVGAPYAREYFRCQTADGRLVWLYRDARTDTWHLQGWWA